MDGVPRGASSSARYAAITHVGHRYRCPGGSRSPQFTHVAKEAVVSWGADKGRGAFVIVSHELAAEGASSKMEDKK